MSEGIKNDQDKNRLDLLSSSWVEGVGQVLTFGARKYSAHNWRSGLARSRLLGACLRHVFAYLRGEDCDPETGLLHLYHASCCLMFASELHFTKPETDDRYQLELPLGQDEDEGHEHIWTTYGADSSQLLGCSICGATKPRASGLTASELCEIHGHDWKPTADPHNDICCRCDLKGYNRG
jgi:hypothetical protein